MCKYQIDPNRPKALECQNMPKVFFKAMSKSKKWANKSFRQNRDSDVALFAGGWRGSLERCWAFSRQSTWWSLWSCPVAMESGWWRCFQSFCSLSIRIPGWSIGSHFSGSPLKRFLTWCTATWFLTQHDEVVWFFVPWCPMVSHGVPWPRNAFPSLGCRWPGFQQRCVGSPNLWRRQPRRFHWVAGNLAVTGGKPGRVRWCDAQHISFEISDIFRSYRFSRFSRFCRFCLSMFSFRRWFLSCFRHSAAHFRPTNEHRPHTAHIGVGVVPLINFCCRVKTVTSCANPLVAFQSPFFFSL